MMPPAELARLVVTTAEDPAPALVARAELVAARCRAPYLPRGPTIARLRRRAGARLAYVVGRDGDRLETAEGRLSAHPGLLRNKLRAGRAHPLLRAVAPVGPGGAQAAAPPPTRVIDATLGLAQDALHLAAALDCQVLGLEASPALYSLLEEGLPRVARLPVPGAAAAANVTPRLGDARSLLGTMVASSQGPVAEVVFLDPMFEVPRRAQPGWDLLRLVAHDAPLDGATLEAAFHAARLRVVLKVAAGAPAPAAVSALGVQPTRVSGKALDYLVLAAPQRAGGR